MDYEVLRQELATIYVNEIIGKVNEKFQLTEIQKNAFPQIIMQIPPQFFQRIRSFPDILQGTVNYVLRVFIPSVPIDLREIETQKNMQLTYGKAGKFVDIILEGKNLLPSAPQTTDKFSWYVSSIAYFSENQAYSTIPIRNVTAITLGMFTAPFSINATWQIVHYKQVSIRIEELDTDAIYVSPEWRYHFLCNAYINLTSRRMGLYPVQNTYSFRRPITKISKLTFSLAYPFEKLLGGEFYLSLSTVGFAFLPIPDGLQIFVANAYRLGLFVYTSTPTNLSDINVGDIVYLSGITVYRTVFGVTTLDNELTELVNSPQGVIVNSLLNTVFNPDVIYPTFNPPVICISLEVDVVIFLPQTPSFSVVLNNPTLIKGGVIPRIPLRLHYLADDEN